MPATTGGNPQCCIKPVNLFCGNFSTLVKYHKCLFDQVCAEKETEKTSLKQTNKIKPTKNAYALEKNQNKTKAKKPITKKPRALQYIIAIKIRILS